MNIINK